MVSAHTSPRLPAIGLALLCAALGTAAAPGEMTAETVLDFARMSPGQREALLRGEILVVMTGDEATEDVTPSNLYSGLVMWVPQPMDRAVRTLTAPPRQREGREQTFEIPESGMLPEVAVGPGYAAEIKKILSFSGGGKVNLGTAELASLRSLDLSMPLEPEDLSSFSDVYRRLLEQRVLRYRRDGLRGIAPYTRGMGRTHDVANELRLATDRAVAHMASFFPDFCQELRRFPETGRNSHRYLLVRDSWDDRPQYVLVHRMADVTPIRALLMHREFFVSQGYDAMQLLILLVPYRYGTLIALSTDVFTDQVSGFGSGLLHRIGRRQVRKSAMMRLEKTRMEIEGAGDPEVVVAMQSLERP